MIELYDYQKESVEQIESYFQSNRKVLLQLPTGSGKTFVFSFFSKNWILNNKDAKILILVHRKELLKQSCNSLRKIGLSVETLTSDKKKLNHLSMCYVAMVETASKRLTQNPDFFKDITLVIADECHLLLFEKVFTYFNEAKILGVTATPLSYKKISFTKCHRCKTEYSEIKICCNFETYEYTRKFTFSEIYDEIVSTVQVSELIEIGSLVPEVNFSVGNINRENLKIDSKTGDFDVKDSDEYYSNNNSVLDVVLNYEKICLNKKTLIFNNSTATNLLIYNSFKDSGYDNIKLMDSVNECENRDLVLEWFKNTPNAILLNCGILTAGFDEETIEAIIMNRATTSLMLYIQIAGRGARSTNLIFKDKFIYIDLGGNINAHGNFSDDVDWQAHFFGTNDKPRPKKIALEDTRMCTKCELIIPKRTIECPECAHIEMPFRRDKTQTVSKEIATLASEYPLPNGAKIVKYVKSNGKDRAFAYSILVNQVVDVFIYRDVTKGQYIKSLNNGTFYERVKVVIERPTRTFFPHFGSKDLRSFEYLTNKIKEKLDIFYGLK